MESIQAETSSLMTRLKNSEKKVLSSSDDVKKQFLAAIQVKQSGSTPKL